MEPAKKHQPNIEPDIRPDFGVIQGGGESTPERGNLTAVKHAEEDAGKNLQVLQGGEESTPERANLSLVKDAETSRQGFWVGESQSGISSEKQTVSLKSVFRKKGALGGLIALGLGLPTIIAIFLSPALVLQQFIETMTEGFNDQLAAIDVRSTLLLKKKYNSTLTKRCGTVTIACKYRSIRMNSGLAKRLQNAGITIKGNDSLVPGRVKPTSFEFNGKEISAKNLLKEARTDPALRKALRKGYDPLYAAFSDKKSADIRTRLGLKKSSNVKSSTNADDMNEDMKKTAAGENNIPEDRKKLVPVDDDGNPVDDESKATGYLDSDGKRYSPEEGRGINSMIDESLGREELAKKVGKTATKASLKGALTATAFGAGAVDSACTAWTMIRVAGFAAKVYQQRQLVRYYYEFAKFSHKQKYGDATAEEADYFLTKLTSTNSEGKNALDSDAYRFAAYGDVFNPTDFTASTAHLKKDNVSDSDIDKILVQNETSKYINGQLVGTSLMAKIAGLVTGSSSASVKAADKTCGFVKSWKGQALVFGLAAAGAITAFFTGGFTIGPGAIAQGAVSIAISVTFALLQPKLIEMAKGEVIQGDENGNETGNAAGSGAGAYNAQAAQGRGLGVATQQTYQAYSQLSTEVAAKYAKEDRESRSPFDPTSKNTFLGGIMATITPFLTKTKTVGSTGLSLSSFVTSNIASLGMSKPAYAANDKYSQCDDPEYKEFNLAADPFCNLRYAIPVADLNIDPDRVLEYMIAGGYITEEDPTPLGAYADYVKKCFERENSIGDGQTSAEEGDGKECIIGEGGTNEERNKMFRLFYIDTSIEDGFDNDFDEVVGDEPSGGVELTIASFNIRGSNHDGEGGTLPYTTRMEKTVETIQREEFDVIGFQEFVTNQRKEFVEQLGDTYALSSTDGKSDNGNGIAWKKANYDLVTQGTQPNLVYTVGNRLKAPWVKLRDKTTGQEFYFLNTHDPANVHDKPVTKNAARRTANAEEHVKFMKEKASEGVPVFISGDFNSAFSKRKQDANVTNSNISSTLPYCIMTSDNTIQNAFDIYKGRSAKCPNDGINWTKEDPGKDCSTQIDHLYILSPAQPAQVPQFGCVRKGDKAGNINDGNGSDHDTVKMRVVIPSSTESSGNGSTFVIGTYNQERSRTESEHKAATENIVNKKMDVVGTQETMNPKFSRYKNYLTGKGYDVYPRQAGSGRTCSSTQAIFYNKSKFAFLKGTYFEIPRYPDPAVTCNGTEKTTARRSESGLPSVWTHIPVVWLQDTKTKQTIIVINTHNVANVEGAKGTQPAKSRYRSAQIYIEKIKELKTQNPGIPIFFTGDFNEGINVRDSANVTYQGKQSNLLFCMFAQNGLMKSAAGPAMKCDPSYSIGGVDYIYTTPEVKIDWSKEISKGAAHSDHHVIYAQVTVPGSGGGSTGGHIVGDDYAKECSKYLSAGDCTGECVGFVKFRLVKHGVISAQPLGNGGSVTAKLKSLGFKVDTTPAVNSVMSLRHNSVGHTAMVSKVNSDGSIVVEEYNWPGGHKYGSRKIDKYTLDRYRKLGWLSFAHTEAKYK